MTTLVRQNAMLQTSFDLERFVEDCRGALAADRSHKLVREVVKRAVADPATVLENPG